MSLFKIPKRKETNIEEIIAKTQEEYKPKIKLKGTSLLAKLSLINKVVEARLGEDAKNYLLLDSDEKFLDYCKKAQEAEYIAVDTETSALDNMLASLAGVCIMSDNQKPAYAPVGHISAITEALVANQVSKKAIVEGLTLLLDKKWILHNSYFDIVVLYITCGIRIPVWFDTLPASHLLNENEQHGLKYLYDKYCTDGIVGVTKFADLFEGIPFIYINPNIAKAYAAHDAEMTMALFKFQYDYLCPEKELCKKYDLTRLANLFWNESMPMIDVLVDMKLHGMDFDFEQAEKLRKKYTKCLEEAKIKFIEACKPIKKKIDEYNETHPMKPIENPPNYNSSDQMRAIFYDIIKIGTVYRKEPRGTGKPVIEAILSSEKLKDSPIIPIVKALNEVKMYDKAISSFIDKLTEDAKLHKGKIHANINLTGTRCVVGDTLILTDRGYFSIKELAHAEDIIEKDKVGIIVNQYLEYENYTHTYRYNNRETIKIRTFYGFELEGTVNHPVIVENNKFKEMHDIKLGDFVFVPLGYNKFPKDYLPLNKNIGSHRIYGKSKEIYNSLPDLLNEEVAELLGMYHADGSINTANDSYRLTITNHNKKVIARVTELYKSIFSCEPYIDTGYNKIKNNYRSEITITSIALCWLEHYIKHGARNKCIPKEIMQSPRSVVLAYIKGLTLDSSYYLKHGQDELKISVYNYLDAVFIQAVLANCGIVSSVIHRRCLERNYSGHCVIVKGNDYLKFMQIVGTIYDYPIELQGEVKSSQGIKFIEGGIFVKVREISRGVSDVYDFHIPKTHTFLSNCFISHNTGRLSSSNPNMQQCPSKLKDIRLMFKAPKDYVMVSCDFSKQEPCILASASNDSKLIKTFNDGIDIYSVIASMAFDCPYEDCLEHYPDGDDNYEGAKRRSSAKKIVLSIMYSKGMKTLSEEMGFSVEKTTKIFNNVLDAYPEMTKWMKERVDSAFKLGYTENIFGRKRRLPDLLLPKYEVILPKTLDKEVQDYYKALYIGKLNSARSKEEQELVVQEAKLKHITIHLNDSKIAKSQREIVNFNIQGAASSITLRAMLNIAHNKRLQELGAYMVMSIHD